MSNRTDWANVAEEAMADFFSEEEIALHSDFRERFAIELHDAYIAGQEGSPRVEKAPGFASSMADLADIGAEMFDRLASIAMDMVPRGTWSDQPQHVRDGVCILFSMIRNRATAEMQLLLRAERNKRDTLAKERSDV